MATQPIKENYLCNKAFRLTNRLNPLAVISKLVSNGNSGSQTYY